MKNFECLRFQTEGNRGTSLELGSRRNFEGGEFCDREFVLNPDGSGCPLGCSSSSMIMVSRGLTMFRVERGRTNLEANLLFVESDARSGDRSTAAADIMVSAEKVFRK